MDTKLLHEIGLSEGEIKVYLALLKLGQTKTGLLSKEAQVSSSKVYKILDRLEKKGLAGHIIQGQVSYFKAMPPSSIIDYIEEKESKIKEEKDNFSKLLPQLENIESIKKSQATLFEGAKATTNLFRNILTDLKKGDEYFVIGAMYGESPGLRDFFFSYHKERAKLGIKVNMLANYETKGNLEKTTELNSEVKYLPKYFMSKLQITFYKNKAFICIWTKNPKAFLIEDDEAVQGFKAYFDILWKIARK